MALPQKLVIYDNSLANVMRSLTQRPAQAPGKPYEQDARYAQFESVQLKYELNLSSEAYATLQSNPILKQEIQYEMMPIVRQIVANGIVRALGLNMKPGEVLLRRVNLALSEGRPQVEALIKSKLDKHTVADAAWRKYWQSTTKDLVMSVVGIALSAASIALAVPTGGASLALTIVGGTRAVAGTVNKLAECWRNAEEQRNRVMRAIATLLAAYSKSVHGGRAMQINGAILDVSGITPVLEMFMNRQLLPSVKKIEADLAAYKGKLGHLYVVANKLAVQLFELLDNIDDWKAQHPGQEMPGLAKAEKRIRELLDSGAFVAGFRNKLTIGVTYDRYQRGMEEYDKLNAEFQKLRSLETNPRAIAILNGAIKVLGNLAFAGSGYATGVDTETVRQIASLVVVGTGDTLGTANDFAELVDTTKRMATPAQIATATQQFEAQFVDIPIPVRPPVLRPTPLGSIPRPANARRPAPPVPPRKQTP